jgi:hypothetical protein
MKLTKKQTIAIDILQDDKTEYIIFGGGAVDVGGWGLRLDL